MSHNAIWKLQVTDLQLFCAAIWACSNQQTSFGFHSQYPTGRRSLGRWLAGADLRGEVGSAERRGGGRSWRGTLTWPSRRRSRTSRPESGTLVIGQNGPVTGLVCFSVLLVSRLDPNRMVQMSDWRGKSICPTLEDLIPTTTGFFTYHENAFAMVRFSRSPKLSIVGNANWYAIIQNFALHLSVQQNSCAQMMCRQRGNHG